MAFRLQIVIMICTYGMEPNRSPVQNMPVGITIVFEREITDGR